MTAPHEPAPPRTARPSPAPAAAARAAEQDAERGAGAVPDAATSDRELAERAVAAGLVGDDPGPDPLDELPAKYEFVGTLGRGGGGEVYLARDRNLDRLVAIKYLSGARPVEIERFRREARFTARLKDASIVRVFELDEHGGRPFIVMEYVDGGNLAEADLDLPTTVEKVRDAAVALSHAHAAGIVHRDVKPENVLLDREGRVHLTDFGLARDLGRARGETLSHEGTILGTPALMPPEQARGELEAVDARSDVYALGATLYTLVVGRPPFEGSNLIDLLHAVIHDPPRRPRAVRPEIPVELEEIVLRCLQKERANRYATAAALAEALDGFLRTQRVQPEGRWFWRLVQTLVGDEPAAGEPDPGASGGDDWSTGLEAVREIAAWDADRYRVSTDIRRTWPRLDGVIQRMDRVLAARPDTAWARFYRGAALYRRGRFGEALEEMERSVDRVPDRAGAWFELGRLYLDLYLAEARLARKHLQASGVEHSLELAKARLDRAMLAMEEARRGSDGVARWQLGHAQAVRRLSEGDLEASLATCDRVLARDPDAEEVWRLRGDVLELAGGDPFESWERAADIRRSYHEVHLAVGTARLARGHWRLAREAFARALRIHPELSEALALDARARWGALAAGEATDDLGELQRALERAREEHPRDFDLAVTLGEILRARGLELEDEALLQRALGSFEAARELHGCQNRAEWLIAETLAARARLRIRRGAPRRAEIDAVLDACRPGESHAWQHEPWRSFFEELETERG